MPSFIQPNSEGRPESEIEFQEAWSAAARAAAAAARGQRGKGTSARKDMARAVYAAAGGKTNPVRNVARSLKLKREQARREFARDMARRMAGDSRLAQRAIDVTKASGAKKMKSIEKVRVDRSSRPDSPTSVKIVRRHATSGKGKSRTYSNISKSSKARLERALGSGAKGYYFTSRGASKWSGMGRDENRGETKTGMISYNARKRKK